ncbi:MAG: radical SAM protein, partial [Deltaproteobacteria bacterium]|nr:radical SAM protein [Deltaproteobacteria bacterium]
KGCTAEQAIDAGRKTLAAGFELCFYVMPGLGGRELSAEHARGTAQVVREVAATAAPERPLFVRLRTTAVSPGTPLDEARTAGRFELPDDVEVAREIRAFLEALGDAPLRLVSDHSLNLLPELEGEWPADRDRLLGVVDEFLGLPEDERAAFALGRRLGLYWTLADRHDRRRRMALEDTIAGHGDPGPAEILRAAAELRERCV